LGLAGLGLLVWHLSSIWGDIRRFLRKNLTDRSRTLFYAFCMAAFFNFVNAQFSGDLNDNRRLWFFLGMVVALMQVIKDRIPVKDNGSNA